jgi:hypothetical protein
MTTHEEDAGDDSEHEHRQKHREPGSAVVNPGIRAS